MTAPSTASRFRSAVKRAHNINPHHLALTILADSAERRSTLRAATYDAKVSVGARGDAQPERMLELVHDVLPVDRDNFIALDRAVVKCLDAVSTLNAEAREAGADWDSDSWRTDDWSSMLRDATVLTEPRHVERCEHRKQCQVTACAEDCPRRKCRCACILEDALAVGRDIDAPVKRFAASVTAITKIRRRYTRRAPTKWEQMREAGHTPDTICDPCASITPPEFHPWDNKGRQCCRWYNDLWNRTGQRPPPELVWAKHHAPQSTYRARLSKWEQECENERLDELLSMEG